MMRLTACQACRRFLQKNISLLSLTNPVLYTRLLSTSATQTPHQHFSKKIKNGPNLEYFIVNSKTSEACTILSTESLGSEEAIPYLPDNIFSGNHRKVFFDVYGCQMNVNDTEIAWSILKDNNFERTTNASESDIILIMTCSITENAEEKIWNRLKYYAHLKTKRQCLPHKVTKPPVKIGILGCMAERLKELIIEETKAVDLVCGPDSYRDLPRMLALTQSGQTAVNVLLSLDETYGDVTPVRLNTNSPSAFVSIMRGCDNMCTYCIVPFTRGRERSRPISSIIDEVRMLSDHGIKEVMLLGQNVNSYRDMSEYQGLGYDITDLTTQTSKGFNTLYKPKVGGRRFSELLDKVSQVSPEMRIRFTSPHPKDFPDEVLYLIKERANICNHMHLPAQSGSTATLERMRRGYTREAYINLVHHIRDILPEITLTSDFIAGFCEEKEDDHQETISLIQQVKYQFAFCYPYSMRKKTRAYHHLSDNVPQDVKVRRSTDLVNTFREQSLLLNKKQIGQVQLVLVEGESKKSQEHMSARNEANTKVILPQQMTRDIDGVGSHRPIAVGDYVAVQITDATSQTLLATPLHFSTLHAFTSKQSYVSLSMEQSY